MNNLIIFLLRKVWTRFSFIFNIGAFANFQEVIIFSELFSVPVSHRPRGANPYPIDEFPEILNYEISLKSFFKNVNFLRDIYKTMTPPKRSWNNVTNHEIFMPHTLDKYRGCLYLISHTWKYEILCVYLYIFDYAHNLRTNYSLKVINYKISARDENLRLFMTEKFKRGTILTTP